LSLQVLVSGENDRELMMVVVPFGPVEKFRGRRRKRPPAVRQKACDSQALPSSRRAVKLLTFTLKLTLSNGSVVC
jgi:hypothetical protein